MALAREGKETTLVPGICFGGLCLRTELRRYLDVAQKLFEMRNITIIPQQNA